LNITITNSAIEELNKKIRERNGVLKIKYEIEDCGCTGGVPFLWFVNSSKNEDDLLIHTNNRPVLIEKSILVHFDEELKIDYSRTANCFQLKSPQQILSGRMPFISKVK